MIRRILPSCLRLPALCLTALLATLPAAGAESLSVKADDLRKLVEARNERVAVKGLERTAATERQGAFRRSFLPKLELSAAQESFRKGSGPSLQQPAYGVQASMSLFNGGRDRLEDARQALVAERKTSEREQVLADETAKARALYWKILSLRDTLEILRQARALNKENLQRADRRVRSGIATEADRFEFEMQDVDLRREMDRIEIELRGAKNLLAVQLGVAKEVTLDFPEPLTHEHDWENTLRRSPRDHEFLVRPAELAAEELSLEASSRSRAAWPRVETYAGWDQFNQRGEDAVDAVERRESVLGLRVALDLFEGLRSRRESAALRAEAEALKAEARFTRRELETHLENELAELKLLHAQVHEAEKNIQRAERYHSLTQSEYTRGVKNSPDVLGASEKLSSARVQRIILIRDFQLAKSHILSKIGK